jgi:protein SCO1/2
VAAGWRTRYSDDSVKQTNGSPFRILVVTLLCAITTLSAACQRPKPQATKRYPFTGRIVSVDPNDGTAVIDGDTVPDFMLAMTMTYKIRPASTLRQLAPGDSISAQVVVLQPDTNRPDAEPDYWLENVKVTAHAQAPPAKGAHSFHVPRPGEQVPDFAFINQDGKQISLHQFRGKVLLLTLIYTRCPFPDFCPRVSSNFAAIDKTLPPAAATELLSISFDPEHDQPKRLRDYAFSVAHRHDALLFRGWQFAVVRKSDLAKIADFFALTLKPDGGLITHNLSTAVIGPDSRIVKWYNGGDWQISDLMKDAADAAVPEG